MLAMKNNLHYQAVEEFYLNQCAKRSGVPLINHIDEGLAILNVIGASKKAREAKGLLMLYYRTCHRLFF